MIAEGLDVESYTTNDLDKTNFASSTVEPQINMNVNSNAFKNRSLR